VERTEFALRAANCGYEERHAILLKDCDERWREKMKERERDWTERTAEQLKTARDEWDQEQNSLRAAHERETEQLERRASEALASAVQRETEQGNARAVEASAMIERCGNDAPET